ncbi:hypothetical protein HYS82_00645 [Candidatus Amesbacteria bacterium]|nr:hypothetical protein [Candidatus Amesbacteria bacterium]MBI2587248.1 hypothetical protein [Candidatus Amesbacteria bacterium]
MNTITKFYFDKAKYLVGDDGGNEIYLVMDYKKGEYKIVRRKGGDQKFLGRVAEVANGLIKRKQGLNFSDRIQI